MRVVTVILVLGLVLVAIPSEAVININACTTTPARCVLKITRAVPHGTWWTQAFDVTAANNPTTIRQGSWFNTTAWYVSPDLVNPPIDNTPANRSGIMMWLEKDLGAGAAPFIIFGVTTWIQGGHVNAYVRSDVPITVQVNKQATFADTWDAVDVSVLLGGTTTVSSGGSVTVSPVFVTLGTGTYRWVVLAPDATQINNQMFVISNKQLSTTDARQTYCGPAAGSSGACSDALYSYRDWQATKAVRTEGAEVLVAGSATFTTSDELYGFFGPATSGITCDVIVCVGGFGLTWGTSRFHVTGPGSAAHSREMSYPICTAMTCPGGPAGTTPLVFNCGFWETGVCKPSGTWTFYVDEHEAAGLTPDMIAILADVVPAT